MLQILHVVSDGFRMFPGPRDAQSHPTGSQVAPRPPKDQGLAVQAVQE